MGQGNQLQRGLIDVPTHLPVFVITTWLLAMLPGAGQALMVRQTLEGGSRLARATIAGNATGLVIWSTAAAAGLSAVLLANPGAYAVVRIAGGIVLIALGISTLRAARPTSTAPAEFATTRQPSWWSAYSAGLGTNLGNPKAGVFAVSVLPQFVTADGPVMPHEGSWKVEHRRVGRRRAKTRSGPHVAPPWWHCGSPLSRRPRMAENFPALP